MLDGQRVPRGRLLHRPHAALSGASARAAWGVPRGCLTRARPSAPPPQDESLLRAHDRLGFTPLDYLRDAQVPLWAAFLDENKELFWSPRNAPGRSPEEWAALLWPMPVADCGVVPPHRPPEGSSTAATAAAPMVRYAAARESEAPEKAEAARTGCHHPGNSGACASPDCGGSVSAAAAAAAAAAGAGTALHASAAPPVIEVAPPVGGGGWRGGWCVPK